MHQVQQQFSLKANSRQYGMVSPFLGQLMKITLKVIKERHIVSQHWLQLVSKDGFIRVKCL